MNLNALASVLAIAEHTGIAGASRASGLPRSTLSRHLAELERALGVRLVERTSRRFRLTAEGAALVAAASDPMRRLSEVEAHLRPAGAPLTGRLRISVPVLFGHTLLGRAAAAFVQAHPGVVLDAVVDDRHVDLLREGFDAALRVNPAPDSLLSGRLLGRNRLLLVATPELAERVGWRGGRADAATWPAVVRPGWGDQGAWTVEAEGQPLSVLCQPRLFLSSPLAILDAVLAHVGAALLPQTLVRAPLADGRLIGLGVRAGPVEEIWLLHAAGRLPSPRLMAFGDVLQPMVAQQ